MRDGHITLLIGADELPDWDEATLSNVRLGAAIGRDQVVLHQARDVVRDALEDPRSG